MALQDVAVNAECREDQYRAGRIPVVAVSVIGEGMGVYDLASVYDVGMRKQRDAAHVCEKEHGKQQLDGDMSSYEFPHGVVSARKNTQKPREVQTNLFDLHFRGATVLVAAGQTRKNGIASLIEFGDGGLGAGCLQDGVEAFDYVGMLR